MSKRVREDEPRTYAFFTFYKKGSYGYDEIAAKGQQAGTLVRWVTDWADKPWAKLEEGEWMPKGDDELVFRVPMRTPLAKQQVTRELPPPCPDPASDGDSWETRQARAYLRYA